MEMSGLGRKRVTKRDSKEDTHPHHHSSINGNLGAHYRDREPEPVLFNADSNGEARTRSRVSQNNDNSYYSELDETRQQFFHRSGNRSNSRSRSRSRSPVYKVRRDAGTYDRLKPRTREFNKRGNGHQFDQNGWEDKLRKPRETKYHTDDFTKQAMMKGVRSSDYDTDYPEDDNSRREHLHDGVSDPRLRRHRSEMRDGDGEGEFHRSSNILCKFFAAGFCRNGKYCRFSHHGAADRKQPQDNKFYRGDSNNHNKWNDVDRLDNGRLGGIDVCCASKGISESKGNGSSWIDDMEMSPDWNYGIQSLKNPVKEEHIGQNSQSRVLKDCSVTNYDQRSSGTFSQDDKLIIEKPIAASHQNYSNSVNIAPVQSFNQNHNLLPYQTSLTAGGSQQVLAATSAADFSVGSNLSNLESGKVCQSNHHSTVEKPVLVQNIVSKEQMDKITNFSASIAQLVANGHPIPLLKQALQMPLHSESSVAVQSNQATTELHTQNNSISSNPNQLLGLGMSNGAEGVPAVTSSHVSNVDRIQENGDKKTDEASKEEESKKTGEDTNDAENMVDEDEDNDDDGTDKENKKGKEDTKGMRAFKFALVEVVKELLKPAWKEGKMNKDGYKNIVKKVVEKVTVTMQTGNVPQTQEKIDHYLSSSKPKLTKLVQAYVSKIKKT